MFGQEEEQLGKPAAAVGSAAWGRTTRIAVERDHDEEEKEEDEDEEEDEGVVLIPRAAGFQKVGGWVVGMCHVRPLHCRMQKWVREASITVLSCCGHLWCMAAAGCHHFGPSPGPPCSRGKQAAASGGGRRGG